MKRKYDELQFFLDQFVSILDNDVAVQPNGKLPQYEQERLDSAYKTAFSMIDKYPLIRQVKTDLKNEGYTDEGIIRHIKDNLDTITDARINKMKDGQYVHIGRPKKTEEEKFRTLRNRKAERYNTIKDIKKGGRIPTDVLRNIDYSSIHKLTTKEAQKVAYWMQVSLKERFRALNKAGFGHSMVERSFYDNGGFVKDIRTAHINTLKGLIRRGSVFLRRETSTVQGMRKVVKVVTARIKDATQGSVDISRYTEDKNVYKLFWNLSHELVDLGYASVIGSEKYKVFGMVESYLQGEKLDNEDLMAKMNAYTRDKLAEIGIYIDSDEKLQEYLAEKYTTRYENLYD